MVHSVKTGTPCRKITSAELLTVRGRLYCNCENRRGVLPLKHSNKWKWHENEMADGGAAVHVNGELKDAEGVSLDRTYSATIGAMTDLHNSVITKEKDEPPPKLPRVPADERVETTLKKPSPNTPDRATFMRGPARRGKRTLNLLSPSRAVC
jgi:hypothetical protein